jgi:PadR family transcriptional regulator PadR
MLDHPADETYGFELSQAAGLAAGSVYPILQRLQEAGWVTSRREDISKRDGQPGRPREFYRLTGHGRREARKALASERDGIRALIPGCAPR